MEEYTFTVTVRISGKASEQEVRDFIGFECGANCSIDDDNPLIDDDSDTYICRVDID